jgi:hypothetical protein
MASTIPIALYRQPFSVSPAVSCTPPVVLVKVGTGKYSPLLLPLKDIQKMNRSEILKALKADDIFANDLKDVPLGQVNVRVLPVVVRPLDKVPTPDEEAAAVQLESANTLEHLMGSMPSSNVFLHVSLPISMPAGT